MNQFIYEILDFLLYFPVIHHSLNFLIRFIRYKDIWKNNKQHTDGNFERSAQQNSNIDSNEIDVTVKSHHLNIRSRQVKTKASNSFYFLELFDFHQMESVN